MNDGGGLGREPLGSCSRVRSEATPHRPSWKFRFPAPVSFNFGPGTRTVSGSVKDLFTYDPVVTCSSPLSGTVDPTHSQVGLSSSVTISTLLSPKLHPLASVPTISSVLRFVPPHHWVCLRVVFRCDGRETPSLFPPPPQLSSVLCV